MKLQAVIFDLDGVITDTSKYHYICWKKLSDEYHIHFDEKINEAFKGVSRIECVKMLFPDVTDAKRLNELAERKNNYYIEMIQKVTPNDLFKGIKEFLMLLRQKGIKTGIGSASKNAVAVLNKLEVTHLFDAVVDGSEVTRSKPAPDVFMLCAEKLHVNYNNCIVLEDASAGIEAAHAAGMVALGIGIRENLRDAEYVIESTKYLNVECLENLLYSNSDR